MTSTSAVNSYIFLFKNKITRLDHDIKPLELDAYRLFIRSTADSNLNSFCQSLIDQPVKVNAGPLTLDKSLLPGF